MYSWLIQLVMCLHLVPYKISMSIIFFFTKTILMQICSHQYNGNLTKKSMVFVGYIYTFF